jgi:hypothetical protein
MIHNANSIRVRDTGTGRVFHTRFFFEDTVGHFEILDEVVFFYRKKPYVLRFVDVKEIFATQEKTRECLHLKGRAALEILQKNLHVMNQKLNQLQS